jgi:dTDP-4-dehydrorhamnose reductase
MLGRALMRELAAYNPVGTAYSRVRDGLVALDLTDKAAVETFLRRHLPKVIIHAAAERRPDVSQDAPEQTKALNVSATGTLARIARDLGAFVLYLSTDYVFDGTQPPYRPGDTPNPLNFYGRTKRDGELALFAELQTAACLRVGVLFGTVETATESAVTALTTDVRNGRPTAIDNWGRRYPTYIPDVAVLIRQMIERHLAGKAMGGIWHWCGNEPYSKYDQAILIGKILNLSTAHLRADPNPPLGAPRPRDCLLDCSALETLGMGQRTPFAQALETALKSSNLI